MNKTKRWQYQPKQIPRVALMARIMELQSALNNPEGEIQRGINARYSRDLRDRELEHHALWDDEVAVFQAAAARRMRGLAADIATAAGAVEVAERIAALPVYAEEDEKNIVPLTGE